jgi:hypothetical protein
MDNLSVGIDILSLISFYSPTSFKVAPLDSAKRPSNKNLFF